ncbi:ABC transporter permease [Allopusillimonas ginsengisoli]|nr:ABC transporter permease [Allopusillimonas ginsengisoli]
MSHHSSILRRPASILGLTLVLLQLIAILFAPMIAPYSPTEANPLAALSPPSAEHWFGTDVTGMDIFSRVIYAARIDLLIGVGAVLAAFVIGVPTGAIIGFYNGPISKAIARGFDFVQSFPIYVLGMALVAITGQQIYNVSFVLAILFIPVFGRLVRADALSLRERPFILAAKSSGAGNFYIIFRHLLPNAIDGAMVQVSISIGMAILLTAGLSFIGAGVRMPIPEWGLMVSVGAQQMILGVWWVSVFPGLAIIVSVLSFALVGDMVKSFTNKSVDSQGMI